MANWVVEASDWVVAGATVVDIGMYETREAVRVMNVVGAQPTSQAATTQTATACASRSVAVLMTLVLVLELTPLMWIALLHYQSH